MIVFLFLKNSFLLKAIPSNADNQNRRNTPYPHQLINASIPYTPKNYPGCALHTGADTGQISCQMLM
jgi:hypothetical protein